MSDTTKINVLSPNVTEINVLSPEKNVLNEITPQGGLINHAATHASGGKDELSHNSLGGLQGGQSGEYYHLSQSEYANLTTGAFETGSFYPSNNPSGFVGLDQANLLFVNVTGNELISGEKTFFDNIFFESGIDITGFINFYLNQQTSPLEGQVGWHPDYGTVQIGMNGGDVINPVGFKNFYRVKASEAIQKGKVVMAVGSVGNSEFILAQEAFGIGPSGELIMGIAAENIAKNDFGDVVAFGPVKGIDTSSYPLNSILYYDSTVTGGLTPQIPEAPNAKVIVGLNTSQANNGIIFVRVSAGSQLGITDSNVKFTSLNDKDVLFYNLNSGVWLNRQINTGDISGASDFVIRSETGVFYPLSNPSGFITDVDLSGYVTGDVVRPSETGDFVTTFQTGDFYPRSNPSGFIGDSGLSGYATIDFTTGISGYLQSQIGTGGQAPNSVQNIIGSSLFL
jgi:hypothetical protein